ncbi:MAG: protein kinase [Candidatus Wallbacteria bacterium]|nr:protein kinase [Candidatus Wallbacteria bacterium]
MAVRSSPFGPELLERYEPLGALGEGGMGVVFKARDRALGRLVAIKLLDCRLAAAPEAMERFRREARAMAGVTHPGVVRIFDHGVSGGTPYAVQELIEGTDLEQWSAAHGRMGFADAIELTCQVLDALQAAHEAGIVHRDIKPSNVLLTPEGAPKVVDFGIARLEAAEKLTHEGIVLGTPGYVAPEQFRDRPADSRSDVYSTAALLYQLLDGAPPYGTGEPAEVLARQAAGPPKPLGERVGGLPAGLSELVARGLDPDPDIRPGSAVLMAAALREIARRYDADEASVTRQMSLAPGRRPRRDPAKTRAVGRDLAVAAPSTASVAPPGSSRHVLGRKAALAALGLALLMSATWLSRSSPGPSPARRSPAPASSVTSVGRAVESRRAPIFAADARVYASLDRVRVRFRTAQAVRAQLIASSEDGSLQREGTGPERATEHDLTVTGLDPAKPYELRLTTHGSVQSIVAAPPVTVAVTISRDRFEQFTNSIHSLGLGVGVMVRSYRWLFEDLVPTGDPRFADRMVPMLPDLTPDIRMQTLETIGLLGGPEHERLLIDALARTAHSTSGGPEFLEAAQALRYTGGSVAAQAALGMLTPPTRLAEERLSALTTLLGRLARRSERVATFLYERALSGSHDERSVAMDALQEAPGWSRELDPSRLYRASNTKIQRQKILRWSSSAPQALARLLPAAMTSTDKLTRADAAELSIFCSPELVRPYLKQFMDGDRWGARRKAIRALGRLGDPDALAEALQLLSDGNDDARANGALALAENRSIQSLPKLLSLLESGDPQPQDAWVSAAWLAGLAAPGSPDRAQARELFLRALRRGNASDQGPALWGLGRTGLPQDVGILQSAALSAKPTDRLRALEALWWLDRTRCRLFLEQALSQSTDLPHPLRIQLESLLALTGSAPAKVQLFAPRGMGYLVLEPAIEPGRHLSVFATGWLEPGEQPPGKCIQVREGAMTRALSEGAGVSLDAGPLAVGAAAPVPRATPPHGGWVTIYWTYN